MAGFLNSTSKKSGLKTSGKKTGTGKGTGGGGGGGTTGAGSKSGSIWGAAKTVTDMVSDNFKNMLGGNKSTVSSAGKTAAPASSATLTGAANALTNRSGTGSGGTGLSGGTGSGGTGSSSSSGGSAGGSASASGATGSNGSAGSGRSEYWGTRGDLAKEYQEWLNSQGAGLSVDGIWGKNTENAYQQNKSAFEEWLKSKDAGASGGDAGTGGTGTTTTAGINSGDLEALLKQYQTGAYTPRSDEELRAAAEAQYEAEYNANVLAAKQKNEEYQQSINQQIASLQKVLSENQAATQKQYELNGNALQRMLTARGLGRSSYAGDVAQNNVNNASEALSKLLSDYAASAGQLSAQGAMYNRQTADTLSQLMRDRAGNVSSAYNQLKSEEYERGKAAQDSYNQIVNNLQSMLSDRSLTQQQLAESIRQFNEQLKENQRQFNLSGK